MDLLRRHEAFEMDVLDRLKRSGLLDRLVFGGGTMLRLCHDMPRYSADLDFWLLRATRTQTYFRRLKAFLEGTFELTDSRQKFFTLLFEIRTKGYPRRLKLEIRHGRQGYDFEEKIAFSKYGTRQVLVKGLTLPQMMKNKVEALLDRREIRDAFDLEFLLRRGVELSASTAQRLELERVIERFRPQDYRVTLGSLLERETRGYYLDHRFSYVTERLRASLAQGKRR